MHISRRDALTGAAAAVAVASVPIAASANKEESQHFEDAHKDEHRQSEQPEERRLSEGRYPHQSASAFRALSGCLRPCCYSWTLNI